MEHDKFQDDCVNKKYEERRSYAIEMKKKEVGELADSYRALLRGGKRTKMPRMSDVLWGDIDACTNLIVTHDGLLTAQCAYRDGGYVIYRTWVPVGILEHYGLV